MTWFRKKQPEVYIPWGTLRIVKTWSGHYKIEEYDAVCVLSCGVIRCGWRTLKEAGGFDRHEDALERIRFMGKLDMVQQKPAETEIPSLCNLKTWRG